jgi:hypothetical protein
VQAVGQRPAGRIGLKRSSASTSPSTAATAKPAAVTRLRGDLLSPDWRRELLEFVPAAER